MSFIHCACGTRNSAFNPRCMACGARIAEIPSRPRAAVMTAKNEAPRPGKRFGSWIVLSLLGRGSTGDVLLAEHDVTGEKAALKVLSGPAAPAPTSRRRFLREASVLQLVSHCHLARILEVSETDGQPWIALKYLEGRSLEVPSTRASLDRRGALLVVAQIAEALGAVHAAGIVHRDVKPSNVVLVAPPPNPDARLVDFGFAASIDRPLDSLRTEAGVVLGSLAYSAPEIVVGDPATPGSDLWSLGVMAFELASGRLPFSGATRAELAAAIVNGAIPTLEGAGGSTVARLLERSTGNRVSSAVELAGQLRKEAGAGPG